jgi:hypothetical protein
LLDHIKKEEKKFHIRSHNLEIRHIGIVIEKSDGSTHFENLNLNLNLNLGNDIASFVRCFEKWTAAPSCCLCAVLDVSSSANIDCVSVRHQSL